MSNNNFDNTENVAKFNKIIAQTSDSILCNPECQRQRQADKLKIEWEKTKINLINAPQQADEAEKKYYTFIGDEYKYNLENNKKINDEAKEEIKKYTNQIIQTILNIETINQDNNTILQNTDHINLLIYNFQKNNNEFNGIHESKNDIETNNRKTYYNSMKNISTQSYTLYYIIIYYTLLIIYFIYLYFTKELIQRTKIIIVIVLLSYPVLIKWIFFILSYIYNFIVYRIFGLDSLHHI